jgi:hypothetical protein
VKVDTRFEDWWFVGVDGVPFQLEADAHFDIFTTKGPFKTPEDAIYFRWWDQVPEIKKRGGWNLAKHCLKCGWFARRIAGDDSAVWYWYITDCRRCGIIDSRTYKKD